MLAKLQSKAFAKTLLIIFVVAVCFVFAYIKDASASEYGQLLGRINGKTWAMKSVVLKKRTLNGVRFVVLEFRNKILSETDLCNDDLDVDKLLVQIPVSIEKGLRSLNFDEAIVRMNGDSEMNALRGYQEVELNLNDLITADQAFVEGRLQVDSKREKTDISGKFHARVCN